MTHYTNTKDPTKPLATLVSLKIPRTWLVLWAWTIPHCRCTDQSHSTRKICSRAPAIYLQCDRIDNEAHPECVAVCGYELIKLTHGQYRCTQLSVHTFLEFAMSVIVLNLVSGRLYRVFCVRSHHLITTHSTYKWSFTLLITSPECPANLFLSWLDNFLVSHPSVLVTFPTSAQ